jgi:hypothetical protein
LNDRIAEQVKNGRWDVRDNDRGRCDVVEKTGCEYCNVEEERRFMNDQRPKEDFGVVGGVDVCGEGPEKASCVVCACERGSG